MSSYAQKLRDPRWQKRRLEILEAANWKCEDCGDGSLELQVHHTVYARGWQPWDYDARLLIAVCAVCHAARQQAEERIHMAVGQTTRLIPLGGLAPEFWFHVQRMAELETKRSNEA